MRCAIEFIHGELKRNDATITIRQLIRQEYCMAYNKQSTNGSISYNMLAFLIVPLYTQQEVVLHFMPVFLRVGRCLATSAMWPSWPQRSQRLAVAAASPSSISFLMRRTLPTALPTLQQVLYAIFNVAKLPTTLKLLSSPHHACSTLSFMKYSDMKFNGSKLIVPHATRT